MKTNFKLGSFSINVKVESGTTPVLVTARNGVKLEVPELDRTEVSAAKDINFNLDAVEIQLEYEAGEIPEIYKTLAPMFSELVAMVQGLRADELSLKKEAQKLRHEERKEIRSEERMYKG